MSTVHVTTIHNYRSSCTHTYINSLNEHVHSFADSDAKSNDSDSADDDSDDDDVPDLMDPDDSDADDDMPDLGFIVAQAG